MAANALTVERVGHRTQMRRFRELPFALHRHDPRWAPPVVAYERWRLDPQRNPFFDRGDAVYLLARRLGRPVGRMTAHIRREGDQGWFGFYDVDDDADVARALLDHARQWLAEQGCATLTGPASFTTGDEAGVLVAGFDQPGVTGRPWHPPWYAAHLEAAGLAPAGETRTWRLPARATPAEASGSSAVDRPPQAGSYVDPALLLGDGDGEVAAVPDVAAHLRGVDLRSTRALARVARERAWEACVIVRLDGDPARLVPAVQAAAGRAGYRWVVSPWTPDDGPPETVHRTYTGPI